jgi:hypothetical protein
MAGDPKYICIDTAQAGPAIIIFPNWMDHSTMAKVCVGKVLSGGFVSFDTDKVTCHGQSTSLGLRSRTEDTKILMRELGVE